MVKFLRLAFIWILSSLTIVTAQNITVSATTDTSIYKVGDFIKYQIEITHENGVSIYLSSVKDSIKTLEYIQTLPSEKKEVDKKIIERYNFIFSKYDSAQVTIPSITIEYVDLGGSTRKTIKTNPITITVRTIPVNVQEDIRDAKAPIKVPLNWLLIGLIVLGIFALMLAGYFIYRYYKKKNALKENIIPDAKIPPHEIALAKLSELEKKKLWQNGLVKDYHSEVTEITRQYFEDRFNFRALEITSAEILVALSYMEEGKKIVGISDSFFSNADLVKFAKFEPMPKVNEEMMKQAYDIVDQTIPVPQPKIVSEGKMFSDVTFAYPFVLWLLLFVPALAYWYWKKSDTVTPSFTYSSLQIFGRVEKTLKEKLAHLPAWLKIGALAFFIIAAARPQSFSSGENFYTEGIDIAMVLDISGSMLAEDFKPNRVDAAKKVIDDFIAGRTNDKIGLVVFSGESFTQCPLTIDYSVLRNLLREIHTGMIEDGTAIGNAIANGVNRLKDSKAKSKVMILLTDGVNNRGEIDPLTAAQIAQKFGIRIYTVGVGTIGEAPYPFQTPLGIRYQMVPVEIDENILRQISGITSGKYFRATDNRKLVQIYEEIDRLEKTRVEVTSYRNAKELFYSWAFIGLFLLIADLGLSRTYLRKLP